MTDASFAKLVPGFEFLQGLVKNAGSALPSIGQWVAPTLNPDELEKRIEELRTVQFWLEQNARMLGATIQALEVQRMTLSTLKTMNVQMEDLRDSLMIKPAGADAATAPAAATGASRKKAPAPATSAVDPMQWWGALTNQFAQLAAGAMKDTAGAAAETMAGNPAQPGSEDAASSPASAQTKSKPAAKRRRAPAAKASRP